MSEKIESKRGARAAVKAAKPKKINVSLYLDEALHEKVQEMAEAETRNLSNMIECIIKKAVAD